MNHNAHATCRHAGALLLLLVLSLGSAESENANTPTRDGCTFENGRTVCVEEDRTETLVLVGETYTYNESCSDYYDDGRVYYYTDQEKITEITTTTTTYYGNSHVVESEVVNETSFREDYYWPYVECK